MNAANRLHAAGQSLWLDNITRALVTGGTLASYIEHDSVTGLTSNPTIFDNAVSGSPDYDEQITALAAAGTRGEDAFFELALDDLRTAAGLFRPVWDATGTVDGWVSLEVSPNLAHDAASTIAEAQELHARSGVPNLLIKVPGTQEGAVAIEELIAAGIPVNVTLLFSREQYLAAAEAYLRGLERRHEAGQDLNVGSVASVFVSRWDVATAGTVPADLQGGLGIAMATRAFVAYRELLDSARWQALAGAGAHPQRLLWASTGTKDPAEPDTFYIGALAAALTVNTIPDSTLRAFADHGEVGTLLPADGGDAEDVIARFEAAGVDTAALGERLQDEGASSFVASWRDLLGCIDSKTAALTGSAS